MGGYPCFPWPCCGNHNTPLKVGVTRAVSALNLSVRAWGLWVLTREHCLYCPAVAGVAHAGMLADAGSLPSPTAYMLQNPPVGLHRQLLPCCTPLCMQHPCACVLLQVSHGARCKLTTFQEHTSTLNASTSHPSAAGACQALPAAQLAAATVPAVQAPALAMSLGLKYSR